MKSRFPRRPSPALIVSMLALFIALGGTTYALTIPHNSVGTLQIRPFGVRNSDIGSRAVSTSKLGDNAVLSSKILDGQIQPPDLGTGVVRASKLGPITIRSSTRTFGAKQTAHNAKPSSRALEIRCAP